MFLLSVVDFRVPGKLKVQRPILVFCDALHHATKIKTEIDVSAIKHYLSTTVHPKMSVQVDFVAVYHRRLRRLNIEEIILCNNHNTGNCFRI